MPKILEDKRRYLFAVYVGKARGNMKKFLEWYWNKKLDAMSEGEILRRYYEETGRKGYDIGISRETERYIEG